MDLDDNLKPHKIFISHSSKDQDYVKLFAELLEDIGIPEDSIICTSVPGYGIPGGVRIYDWLRDQFVKCNLRVIYVLSKNYYESPASLNEMGAAWVTKSEDTLILLPGFNFKDVKGCVDNTKVGISFDAEDFKYRLGELKDTLIREFNLNVISESKWERHRDAFIEKTSNLMKWKQADLKEDSATEQYQVQSTMVMQMPDYIPLEVSFLAVYAAQDEGRIICLKFLGGEDISAGGYDFTPTHSVREVAQWKEALDTLVSWHWAIPNGGEIFTLTGSGFKYADYLKEKMEIDTDKDPLEQIKEFE